MRTFRCDNCGHPLFFENVQCLYCGSDLAFLPHRLALCAIEPATEGQDVWRRKVPNRTKTSPRQYRLCQNNLQNQACKFSVA